MPGAARLTLVAAALAVAVAPLDARLRVRGADGEWRTWWTRGAAPAQWSAPNAALAGAIRWRSSRPGVEWAELPISADLGRALPALRVRVIVARLDPTRLGLALHAAVGPDGAGPWDVDHAPPDAVVAFNAGQ